ncbi:MAG: ABC transporter ATP-binding protein, partial [Eubacterium sp.]
ASAVKQKLGYLPGEIAFFNTMTGTEFIRFMAEMRGMKEKGRMKALLDFFELDPSGRIRKMSKGMKQKIGLVCAFMHNPEVLILDEPTSGLDPLMQSKFIQLVLHEKSEGKTILMSSHSFEEVEKTCDRVGIIKTGRLVALDSVAAIKEQSHKIYRVMFSTKEEARAFAKECVGASLLHNGIQVEVHIPGSLQPFIVAMGRHKVTGLDVVSQDLEDIFMQYYGGENNAEYPTA